MEVDMKDIKWMGWEMEKVDFIINKVVFMMENGKIIICMVLVNFIIRVKN
jgi:hypothetical protein